MVAPFAGYVHVRSAHSTHLVGTAEILVRRPWLGRRDREVGSATRRSRVEATTIHVGDMATVDVDTVASIFDWMRTHGFRTTCYSRERYLDCPDDISQWRTEMQFPIEADPDP